MLGLILPKLFAPKMVKWDSIVVGHGKVSQKQDLQIGHKIARGSYGTVYVGDYCLHHLTEPDDHIPVAVKKVELRKHEDDVNRELSSLLELRAEHDIVHLFNFKEIKHKGLFVLELCEGGDLIDYVMRKRLKEKEIKHIIRWLCHALQRCHDHGIVHTDIKLDNIGLVHINSLEELRLLDFGNSKPVGQSYAAKELRGSPHYIAPELVVDRMFDDPNELYALDVWCVGICAFCLIEGYFPFEKNKYNLKFRVASSIARKFISSILVQSTSRPSLQKCLEHIYLTI